MINGHSSRHLTLWLDPFVIALYLYGVLISSSAAAQTDPVLEHPVIREVVEMVEAGVGDEVIIARIGQMSDLPSLSGDAIAALKRKGVSDRVLLELVQNARGEDTAPKASPRAEGASVLRVILESPFPVSFYEIAVDGRVVATRGETYEGQSEPGRALRQPRSFRVDGAESAYEEAIEPGEHRILVGFEVSRVEDDRRDDWMEYGRQQYVSSGVRAEEKDSAEKNWGANHVAICRVEVGQVCVVNVRFDSKSPTRFGGLPVYSVTYQVEMSPR